jgi:hypothetical protein
VDCEAVKENIHQPRDGFLPPGLLVQIAHTEEGSQEFRGTDLITDLAGGDRSLE